MIEFPHLGLKFNIGRVAFTDPIFGINIYWYGIIISIGFALSVILAMRSSKKYGFEQENVIDLVLIAIPISIICARLYYVIFSWNDFKDDWFSIFNTRRGGLAIYGGIIGAMISVYIFTRWKKVDMWKLFDFGVPYLALGQAIGRWGNFVNQEAFGGNTNLPWGMTGDKIRTSDKIDPNVPVHPTFLYESLMNLAIFFFLLWYGKRKKVDGEVLCIYMILYGIGRAFIESLRTDSLMVGSVRISQLLGVVLAIAFGVLFYLKRKKSEEVQDEVFESGSSNYSNLLRRMKEEEESTRKEKEVEAAEKEEVEAQNRTIEELSENEEDDDNAP